MSEGRIFISYRRGADNGDARSLYLQLERHFGRERVFIDIDDIPVGGNFRRILQDQVNACRVFVAVIGRGWVEQAERLHRRNDFVRIEIEAALARADIPIIPVFMDGAVFPDETALPEVLHDLLDYNGISLRHETFIDTIDGRLRRALLAAFEAVEEAGGDVKDTAQPAAPDPDARFAAMLRQARDQVETDLLPALRKSGTSAVSDAAPSLAPGTIFRDVEEPWCPEMVVIPPGEFLMGSPEGRGLDNERPRHLVKLSRPFALGRFAITFDEYDVYCREAGRMLPADEGWGRQRRPVVNVSWGDAIAYCEWLSARTGQHYRLPSEAEWEYACRAAPLDDERGRMPDHVEFNFGNVPTTNDANFNGEHVFEGSAPGVNRAQTVEVDFAKFDPNPFGLWQMHGNVWEWCADLWHEDYDGAPEDASPWLDDESSSGGLAVLRGGSWSNAPSDIRSAARGGMLCVRRYCFIGFRVCRSIG